MEVEGSDEVGILPADAVATSATFVVWFKLLNQAQREKLQFCHVLENLILTSIASSSRLWQRGARIWKGRGEDHLKNSLSFKI